MMKSCIFNIQRYSLHDGTGIRTIVFFKGCPFHCPWCSNPESLSSVPQLSFRPHLCIHCEYEQSGICNATCEECVSNAKEWIGEYKSVDDIMSILQRDRIFYETSKGGVTLSGGECLAQEDFVLTVLKRCKDENIHTAIETTLALPIKNIKELTQNTDLFLVDIKYIDIEESKKVTGIDFDIVDRNLRQLQMQNANIIPRIPLIPGFSAQMENIDNIIEYLRNRNLMEVHLLPFHKLGESKYTNINMEYHLQDAQPLHESALKNIESRFISNGFHVVVGGN